ncbi:CRISPR system Cascade subunit CasD [Gemmobacter caeni]|uniref:CRISPR system Cascade subunit CasD n=1 Tax=Gemmobacter caeni TaxID=589035 RepID=A0A2T6A9B0_9RHOB|nr:type I-E CRISPR-associated protein Cas5/CasD [Gemmobacter caeni]PTX40395.1 CRISPR system Cascade subunit CasD [Gemmobacter caeni]TWI89910.1 CRISPR system Cascade subunit CasD [Gemmobacter caeni]
MQPHLVFTLTAALGAMGDLAGHERRGTLDWPGRSAILGLLGAALGLRRDDDFSALEALSIAVAVFDGGTMLRDYHTVETVPSAAVKRANSRPEALRLAGKLRTNTTITLRDYRGGACYGVAVSGEGLERLRAALERPVFTLWLGRKSCPLAAPVGARIVSAEGPEQALRHLRLPPWREGAVARRMMVDATLQDTHVEQRMDRATDRAHWHFVPRAVAVRAVCIAPEAAA